jgi:lauroyl/myristoyl acyltransferase
MIFETIKMFSISNKELKNNLKPKPEIINDLYDSGQNVQLECGHFFNWETLNLYIGLVSRYPFIGVSATK